MKKREFSKVLLALDYTVFGVLLLCTIRFPDIDFISIDVAWITQLGISTAAYYWKTKCDNRTKVPIKVIESLPEEIRKEINLTEIITAIIQSE